MALFAKDPQSIIQESIDYMQSNTAINSTGPGSKFRTLLEILKNELDQSYKKFDYNVAVGLIHGSTGKYLDYLGDMFGLTRGQAQSASVYKESNTVKFYVDSGTFGDINGSSDITIPKGTRLWAIKSGNKVYFIVDEEAVLSSGSSYKYVTVKALRPGLESNVGSSSIVYHEINKDGLLVTNVSSIDNGTDEEGDENFRFRIINEKLSEAGGNLTAIKMAALSIDGVADVSVLNRHFGSSTVAVLVKSTTPTVSDELLLLVKDAVLNVASEGSKVIVSAPDYIEMKFNITIKYALGTTTNQKTEINNNIRNIITDHVNNLDIAEAFSKDALYKLIVNSSDNVLHADFNSISIIKNIKGGFKINKSLIDNYTTSFNEKLIMSTDNNSVVFN